MIHTNNFKCGLLGEHLSHSFSPQIHAHLADYEYKLYEMAENEVGTFLKNCPLDAMNVTIPYKEQVIPFLDEIDENATNIGAVNVIKFIKGKNGEVKLKGYNSDIIGFCNSLKPLLAQHHTHALILGTGGAAKAVACGLKSLGIETIYVSRTKKEGALTYEELTPMIIDKYKVIVNTSPIGMYPHVDKCPNIPYELLTPEHLCYDLIYNPDVTLFMKKAKEQGSIVKNGLEMLLLQAFAAWEIWQQ